MTNGVRVFAFIFALGAITVPHAMQQGPGSPAAARITALQQRAQSTGSVRVIVGVRSAFVPEGDLSSVAAVDQRAAIAQAQTLVIDRLTGARIAHRFESIPFFAAQVDAAALQQLAAMPEVTFIQEDIAEPPLLAESAALIRAPAAWQNGYTGAGWSVAILDTGVDVAHPFFGTRVIAQACFSNAGGSGGQTSACPGGASTSTAPGSGVNCPAAFDGCQHGTHVAGIAAGRQYSNGPAMSGIARDASIIAVQIFTGFDAGTCGGVPCALSFISDQIAGLEHVYSLRNTHHIAAVNMSLGGGMYSSQATCDSEQTARKAIIDQLRSAGIATIAASGNNSFPTAIAAPACISSAISVGSVDDGSLGTLADRVSDFSNDAPFLSLLAPGRWITSSVPDDGFTEMSGTSMATPHVTGAWALLKQRKPLATLTEILSAFLSTGVAIADPRSGGTLHRRIDVAAAAGALRVDYMAMDTPPSGAVVSQPFDVDGWALNMSAPLGGGTGVDLVHVWAFPASGSPIFLGAADYGLTRGDVGSIYGTQFTRSGWRLTGTGLEAGSYTIVSYARNALSGQFSQVAVAERVTIHGNPQLWIDSPSADAVVQQPFLIGGWAIDRDASSSTGIDRVQITAYPSSGAAINLGNASYGFARADIGNAFGSQFTNSGFNLAVDTLRGGRYRIVVAGHSTVTNSFSGLREVFVTVSEPMMSIDTPVDGATVSAPFAIGGWAIDRGSSTDSGVDTIHVWAYPDPGSGAQPIFVGEASRGITRTDVGSIFGAQYADSGFNLVVSGLASGHTYQLVVFPHSSVSGAFDARAVTVTVR